MVARSGSLADIPLFTSGSGLGGRGTDNKLSGSGMFGLASTASTALTYFRMRGFSGSAGISWTVSTTPDVSGSQAPSGSLSNIHIVFSWSA